METDLWAHLEELRKRLIIGLSTTFLFFILLFLAYPLIVPTFLTPLWAWIEDSKLPILTLGVLEPLFIRVQISLFLGLLLSLPVWLIQALGFLFPGLKQKEKSWLLTAILSSLVLGSAGFIYVYTQFLPALFTIISSGHGLPTQVLHQLQYSSVVQFILLSLLFGVLFFQLPMTLAVILGAKITTIRTLWKRSREVILTILIISALMTPPDLFTQLALGVPLIVLYFTSLVVFYIFKKIKSPRRAKKANSGWFK